jgi:RalA-binding protein 1
VSSLFAKPAEGDIVDRGLITMDLVDEIFARYTDQMVQEMPAVIFPPGTTASEIRKDKPVLFLSIMASASGDHPKLQRALQREMMYVFAERIFLAGEKSVELIQAIHVSVVWYWPPEHFEELKFYQLTHMAAVMAIDIGLGKRGPQRRILPPFSTKEGSPRRAPPDPMTLENRRTWLTCHYLCANTSMAMHRPNLLRWTPFMSDCVEVLMSSPDAAPTDKYFCHLVWNHRHAEEIALQFAMDDSSIGVNITELRTQHALKGLQREMDKYRMSVSREEMKREYLNLSPFLPITNLTCISCK